jgi:hypothetical protein
MAMCLRHVAGLWQVVAFVGAAGVGTAGAALSAGGLTDWQRRPAEVVWCGRPYRMVVDLPTGRAALNRPMGLRITQTAGNAAHTLNLTWPIVSATSADALGRVRDVTVQRTRSGQRVEWLFELHAGWDEDVALSLDAD